MRKFHICPRCAPATKTFCWSGFGSDVEREREQMSWRLASLRNSSASDMKSNGTIATDISSRIKNFLIIFHDHLCLPPATECRLMFYLFCLFKIHFKKFPSLPFLRSLSLTHLRSNAKRALVVCCRRLWSRMAHECWMVRMLMWT